MASAYRPKDFFVSARKKEIPRTKVPIPLQKAQISAPPGAVAITMTTLLGDVTSQATSSVSMARNPTMRKSGSKNLSLKAQLKSFKQVPIRQERGKQENTR